MSAQKPQRNCTFMNLASGRIEMEKQMLWMRRIVLCICSCMNFKHWILIRGIQVLFPRIYPLSNEKYFSFSFFTGLCNNTVVPFKSCTQGHTVHIIMHFTIWKSVLHTELSLGRMRHKLLAWQTFWQFNNNDICLLFLLLFIFVLWMFRFQQMQWGKANKKSTLLLWCAG